MMLARGLRLLLAVALLFAWTGALVHPIGHVDEAGAFVHLADGHDEGQRNGNAPDPLCDAIAALAVCINGISKAVVAFPQDSEKPDFRRTGNSPGLPLLAYRSQAPPQYS